MLNRLFRLSGSCLSCADGVPPTEFTDKPSNADYKVAGAKADRGTTQML